MSYPKDKHGTYQRLAKWVEACADESGHTVRLWYVSELRQYEDGTIRVISSDPHYVNDYPPETKAVFEIFCRAESVLIAVSRNKE